MKFSYNKCLNELNKIIPLDLKDLPLIDEKSNKLKEINQYINLFKLPTFYSYMSYDSAYKAIENECVYMSNASSFNDVFEGAVTSNQNSLCEINERNDVIQNNIFVKCFSCKKDDNLMWSHYGDKHNGICIGYDFSKVSPEVKNHFYPVQYSDFRFENSNINRVAIHPFMYLRKSKEWSYEKEWRLVYQFNEINRNDQLLHLGCISEITFGVRTSEINKNNIIELVKDKNISIYETKLKCDSFKLERVKMDVVRRKDDCVTDFINNEALRKLIDNNKE